jgi:hypothetical protein
MLAWVFASLGIICLIASLVVIFYPKWVVILPQELSGKDIENLGEYIGGIDGALLSFAGISFLIVTIFLQKQDLAEQRRELRATRRIHQEQQFANIFFQLLGFHNELVKSFVKDTRLEKLIGKEVIFDLYFHFRKEKENQPAEGIKNDFREFVEKEKSTLKQALQSLVSILRFTINSHLEAGAGELDEKNFRKDFYGFISSHLSEQEEFFLLLHLASDPELLALNKQVRELKIFDFRDVPPFDFLNTSLLVTT